MVNGASNGNIHNIKVLSRCASKEAKSLNGVFALLVVVLEMSM
jgi:hypothetical protein